MNHSFRFLPHIPPRRRPASTLLAVALALLASALTLAAAAARATGEHHRPPRLVVRGDSTAVDGPCDARACRVDLSDGRFRGTAVGTGAYTATLELAVADAFPNGEGGMCAPLEGRVVLGAGSTDRLVLDVSGDSCQDGAGPLDAASFTGLARFTVRYGSGRYAHVHGSGDATFLEDAANHHRMTLVGRIASRSRS
jgi:hypothetical protein